MFCMNIVVKLIYESSAEFFTHEQITSQNMHDFIHKLKDIYVYFT